VQHGGCKFNRQISTDNAGETGLHSARNRRLGENTNRNAHRVRTELKFQNSILLTGATGLFGRACLPHLIARHGAQQILALVRRGRDTSELTAMGVRSIELDLCSASLGLSRTAYDSLTESARSIIHAAADIRFGIPLAESRRVNVLATENLLRFAGHCPRLERFAHISTVYVWGAKGGDIKEEAAQPGPFFNSYQQSKFEAEQVTLQAMAVVPATIYRLSTMIYDSSAARVGQFNYFHQLLRLAATNPLRAIPALPGARIDLIASDWAGRVFDFLFAEEWGPGNIVHLCAGPQYSLRVDELFAMTFDLLGLSVTRPKIVTRDEFESQTTHILSTPSRKQMWRSLAHFLPHMEVDQVFHCTRLDEAIASCKRMQRPDARSLFRDALAYCIETQWRQLRSTQLATTA
jgi:nucleoside-diphosphate-sugar epimerase